MTIGREGKRKEKEKKVSDESGRSRRCFVPRDRTNQ